MVQAISSYLSRVAAVQSHDARSLSALVRLWKETVSDSLALHVTPIRFADDRLLLQADATIWLSKIFHLRPTLIRQLRTHPLLAGLRELDVRVASSPPTIPRPVVARPLLSPTAGSLLAGFAEELQDPGLRSALHRLAGNARRTD